MGVCLFYDNMSIKPKRHSLYVHTFIYYSSDNYSQLFAIILKNKIRNFKICITIDNSKRVTILLALLAVELLKFRLSRIVWFVNWLIIITGGPLM